MPDRPIRIQLRRTKGWRMPPNTVKVDRSTKLRGKNLACWCRDDGKPCHADVLLELANREASDA